MSIHQDAENSSTVAVGGTQRAALIYDSTTSTWVTKNQAGVITTLGGINSLSVTAPVVNTGTSLNPIIGISTAVVSSVGGTAPIISSGGTTPTISISLATGSASGAMSSTDKAKLDTITSGAAVASVGVTAPIINTGSSTAPVIAISAATESSAGSLAASDKSKLDTITSGAAVASVGVSAPIVNTGSATAPVIGISGTIVSAVSGTAPIVSSGGTTPAISISAATISAAGSMSATDKQKTRLFIDPMADYGCKFDHRLTADGATTGSTGVITSATIAFVASDVGKRIVLSGAGASGAQYVGTISSLNSGSSVNVSPNTGTTVSGKILQVHTDDLTAWTSLINDINNSTYQGAVVKMQTPNGATPFGVSTFTGRSGISAFLPTITKQVIISGYGSNFNANAGNYYQTGGSCIAYVGTSNASTPFGAVMTFAPTAGASNPNLKNVVLEHFWIDCRNGDQNQALKGISMQSCFAWQMNDIFIMDPAAVGIEWLVIAPGTAGALGEAKDCSRGSAKQVSTRCVDNPQAGAQTTPITTTTALTLTTSSQSFTVGANSLPSTGYLWVQTNLGYPVLCSYTGGGTTTLGMLCSLQDTINAPATVSGSNIVQAVPGNACSFMLDGDLTANANLNHFDTCQCVYAVTPTWGPAAIEFRNSDSNEFSNVVVNGGNNASLAQPNRITKPGVRFMGSNSNATMAARNNVFKSGSAGAGGASNMGILNTAANLLAQAGPNYWDNYQLGNGEGIPTVEGSSYFQWTANGGFGPGTAGAGPVAVAAQTLTAATQTLIAGSLVAIPPQGFQVGTVLRWTIRMTKTAAGTAIPGTFVIMINTTGTTAGAGTVATMALTSAGTAVADTGTALIDFTVRTIGTTASGVAHLEFTHGLQTTGWMAVQMQEIDATMATWNSTVAQQFIMVAMTSGTAVVPTITQCYCEVVKPANP